MILNFYSIADWILVIDRPTLHNNLLQLARMREGNVSILSVYLSMCLSVYRYVWAITSQCLDIETSYLV